MALPNQIYNPQAGAAGLASRPPGDNRQAVKDRRATRGNASSDQSRQNAARIGFRGEEKASRRRERHAEKLVRKKKRAADLSQKQDLKRQQGQLQRQEQASDQLAANEFYRVAQENPDADWGAIAKQHSANQFYKAAQENPDADWAAIAASQQGQQAPQAGPAGGGNNGMNQFYNAAQQNPNADWAAIAASPEAQAAQAPQAPQQGQQQNGVNQFYKAAQENPNADWGAIAASQQAPQNGVNQFYNAAQQNPNADWGAIAASQQAPAAPQAPGPDGISAAVPPGMNPSMPAPGGPGDFIQIDPRERGTPMTPEQSEALRNYRPDPNAQRASGPRQYPGGPPNFADRWANRGPVDPNAPRMGIPSFGPGGPRPAFGNDTIPGGGGGYPGGGAPGFAQPAVMPPGPWNNTIGGGGQWGGIPSFGDGYQYGGGQGIGGGGQGYGGGFPGGGGAVSQMQEIMQRQQMMQQMQQMGGMAQQQNPWGNQMSNLLGQMGQYRAPGQGQVL